MLRLWSALGAQSQAVEYTEPDCSVGQDLASAEPVLVSSVADSGTACQIAAATDSDWLIVYSPVHTSATDKGIADAMRLQHSEYLHQSLVPNCSVGSECLSSGDTFLSQWVKS